MFRRMALTLGLAGGGVATGYVIPPFDLIQFTQQPLPARHTQQAEEYSRKIDAEMMRLPLVQKLVNDPRYEMHRAWSTDRETTNLFTAGTLRNEPGGFNITPLVFVDRTDKSTVSIAHCGRRLTGFPMIVHGGILGTLLDEALGRTAFLSFDSSTGVTANLSLSYKSPTLAHQFLVVRTFTNVDQSTGTKAKVYGTISTLGDKTLVKAQGTFVVPKSYTLASMKGF